VSATRGEHRKRSTFARGERNSRPRRRGTCHRPSGVHMWNGTARNLEAKARGRGTAAENTITNALPVFTAAAMTAKADGAALNP